MVKVKARGGGKWGGGEATGKSSKHAKELALQGSPLGPLASMTALAAVSPTTGSVVQNDVPEVHFTLQMLSRAARTFCTLRRAAGPDRTCKQKRTHMHAHARTNNACTRDKQVHTVDINRQPCCRQSRGRVYKLRWILMRQSLACWHAWGHFKALRTASC